MRIIILRHGIPDLPCWKKIHSSRMPEWIKSYNSAGVKDISDPSVLELGCDLIRNFVVCSDLARSQHSAKIIGYSSPNRIDAIFREAELPNIQIPLIRLTPHVWSMLFRIIWLAGISPGAEPLESFRQRVSQGAEELAQLAKNHNSILFIGHGIINRFLAKELITNGWSGEAAPNGNKYWGYKYWEFTTYSKI